MASDVSPCSLTEFVPHHIDRYLGSINVDLGGGGNDVGLVDTLQGDTVDLEGTRDEQQTRLELLQEDNTLATVTAGQEDEDSSRDNGAAKLGLARSLAVLLGGSNILSCVEAGSLGGSNDTFATVLGTLDLNGLIGDNSGSSGLDGELALEQDALGHDLRTAVLVDTNGQEGVAGLNKEQKPNAVVVNILSAKLCFVRYVMPVSWGVAHLAASR